MTEQEMSEKYEALKAKVANGTLSCEEAYAMYEEFSPEFKKWISDQIPCNDNWEEKWYGTDLKIKDNPVNRTLQWLGTGCLITMYVIMSFYPELYPANIILGCFGGLFYFTWSWRVANKPQMLVNAAGILVCLAGLVKLYLA